MIISARLKRRLQPFLWPLIGTGLVAYFLLHTVNGNHGLIARQTLMDRIISADAAATTLREERQVLERRVRRLSPETLDLDMVDERVRVMLDYSHPNEVMVFFDHGSPAAVAD